MHDMEKARIRRRMKLHGPAIGIHASLLADLDDMGAEHPAQVYRALSSIQRQALCNAAAEHGVRRMKLDMARQLDRTRRICKSRTRASAARWAAFFVWDLGVRFVIAYFAFRGLLAAIS